jgi:uncharacterized protein (TIGR03437 family)
MRYLLLLLFSATAAAQGIITTVAGTDYIFPDDGQPAAQAHLAAPYGIVYDETAGQLYFSDLGLNMVLMIDSKGIVHVVAGTGLRTSTGNGGAARAASIAGAGAIIGGQRVLYLADFYNTQVRMIDSTGTITIAAGTNGGFSGDGGRATKAQMQPPYALAADKSGNFYIADNANQRVRKVDANGIITTVAGNGNITTSGDNGAATNAGVPFPNGLTVDLAGNLYISQGDGRVRKVTPAGIISTLAQNINGPAGMTVDGNGNILLCEQLGDRILSINPNNGNVTVVAGNNLTGFADGVASRAMFSGPTSIDIDPAGNLYVADTNNGRIRKISNGTVTTIAGIGAYTGDGGPATAARLNFQQGVTTDSAGNLYIADTQNNRIREVTPDGTITTIAGNGGEGFSKDGTPAATGFVFNPQSVAISPQGNIVFPDLFANRIRQVNADGTFQTIVGVGFSGSSGDGGNATLATINNPQAMAYDSAGNLYFAEPTRVRKVSTSGIITAFAGNGQFGYSGDGAPATGANFMAIRGLAVDPVGNVYIGDNGANVVRRVDAKGIITTVAGNGKSGFNAGPGPGTSIPLNYVWGLAADRSGNVFISEEFGHIVRKLDPSGNLTIYAGSQRVGTSGDGGSALAASFDDIDQLYCDPAGNLYISDARAGRIRVVQAGPSPSIVLSEKGLTFNAVAGGAAPAPQSFIIVNGAQGTLNWGVTASTTSGGNWLSVNPASGTSAAGAAGPPVQVAVNPSGLAAGDYYGQVLVRANAAPNSPQTVTIVLHVGAASAIAGTTVQPSGLLFTLPANAPILPAAQLLTLTTPSSATVTFRATTTSSVNWFTLSASSGTITPGKPVTLQVLPNPQGLTPGVYNGAITFAFNDNTSQTVQLLLVVTGGGVNRPAAPGTQIAACAPSKLLPLFTSLGTGFSITTGWPSPVELRIVDDCGQALTTGSVTATFSNTDPSLTLNSLGDGRWTGTWQAQNAAPSVSVTAAASTADRSVTGSAQVSGGLSKNANPPPVVAPGGVLNAASYQLQASLAPGSLISIFGSLMAQGTAAAPALPLTNSLGTTTVTIAGRSLPLLYAGPDQVNAMIPYDLPINATHQLIVQRGTAISIPQPIGVLASQSGVFTKDLTGQGLGIVVKVANDGTQTVVGSDTPVTAYDAIVIYCAGLGDVNPRQIAGQQVPFSPLSQTLDTVKVTIGGIDAPVFFAGLTPGFTGLYQVNAYVPTGVTPGNNIPLVITEGGRTGPPVTIPVR